MPCASPGSYRISRIHFWTAWHKRSLALVLFGLGCVYASSFFAWYCLGFYSVLWCSYV